MTRNVSLFRLAIIAFVAMTIVWGITGVLTPVIGEAAIIVGLGVVCFGTIIVLVAGGLYDDEEDW